MESVPMSFLSIFVIWSQLCYVSGFLPFFTPLPLSFLSLYPSCLSFVICDAFTQPSPALPISHPIYPVVSLMNHDWRFPTFRWLKVGGSYQGLFCFTPCKLRPCHYPPIIPLYTIILSRSHLLTPLVLLPIFPSSHFPLPVRYIGRPVSVGLQLTVSLVTRLSYPIVEHELRWDGVVCLLARQ